MGSSVLVEEVNAFPSKRIIDFAHSAQNLADDVFSSKRRFSTRRAATCERGAKFDLGEYYTVWKLTWKITKKLNV